MLTDASNRQKAVREDNLFGKVAIRLGCCVEEQLQECLALQEQLPKERFMRLGDIMVIKGYLKIIFAGIIRYKDIFGKRQLSTFRYTLDTGGDFANTKFDLSACSKGGKAS